MGLLVPLPCYVMKYFLSEQTSPDYGSGLSFLLALVLTISVTFFLLSTMERLTARSDVPYKLDLCFLTGVLGGNMMTLTQIVFLRGSTLAIAVGSTVGFTVIGTIISIMRLIRKRVNDERKEPEDSQFTLLIDEELP